MSWQMQPQQQMQQMPQQMQSMQQQMQHQQMQNPQHMQHQQMHNQQMPQQMQHQQMQPPQMPQQMQGSKGMGQPGKGGKGMMQRPPVQNQVRPPQTRPQQTPPSPTGGQTIVVSGCANATVSNIIKGSFSVSGVNHGKPTYTKDMSPPNVTVLIYFWDDRDGPTFSGWWIGPKVGGDQVWSHADNRTSPTPPPAGWHVPWDGPVDPTLKLTYSTAAPLPAPPPNAPRPQVGKGQVVGARPALKPPVDMAKRPELDRKKLVEAPQNHRKAEEQKRRAAEAEEMQRKRQEEMKRHREEEAQRRKEMVAATSVRKVLAKVRAARPDSYDSLRMQLEESIAANLEAMGSMVTKVGQEAEEVLQATQSRIDEINEQRAEEERKRAEEEKRRRHEAENSAQFIEQAKSDAQTQQSKLQEAEEMCRQLEDEGDPAKLLEQAEAAEKQINSVRDEASSVKSSIYEKQRALGDMIGSKVRRELGEILAKLSTGIRSLDGTLHSVKRRREKVAGKAAAARKINDKKSTFAKFDVDRDGKLNKKEVEAYMKATINFDLPQAILDQIVKKLDPISFAKFRSLHQRLYIAKSELLAREARAAEAAKQIELEEKTQALMSVVHEADASLQDAETALVEAERKRSLLRSMDASIDDIEEGVQRLDSLTKSADEAFSSSHGKIEEAKLRVGDMQTRGEPQLLRLIHREKHGKERLQRLEDLLKDLQEKAKRKTLMEMDQKKSDVVLALWKKISEDTTTVPQLFETMNGGGSISREKFTELLRGLSDLELTDAERDKLFTHVAGNSASMTKETFLEMMKLYYTCIKSTVMSEELSIKSKQVRRLELGAVLEALEGPRNEEVAKLVRLRCRASDGTEGWVTYKGNQGTTFLEPGGQKYVCLQATEITEALDVSSTSIRMLAEGELIEVTEFEKKDGDVTRIKGKAKSDGVHGWITISSPNSTFLQPS